MELNFSEDEKQMLLLLLKKEENTLLVEINHSVHREFKMMLKGRLNMLSAIIEKIEAA